jgi:hypothetical protein
MSSDLKSRKYVLRFGLGHLRVPLDRENSNRVDRDIKDALLEVVSALWGVSVDTYKSRIACTSPYKVDVRNGLTNDSDLRIMYKLVDKRLHGVFTFLSGHSADSKSEEIEYPRNTLLKHPFALEQYLERLWRAVTRCFAMNQLFETSPELHNSFPDAFCYCTRTLMPSRTFDNVACVEFAEQFCFVYRIIATEFANIFKKLYFELHAQNFQDGSDGCCSFELPLFIWQYVALHKKKSVKKEKEHQEFHRIIEKIYYARKHSTEQIDDEEHDESTSSESQSNDDNIGDNDNDSSNSIRTIEEEEDDEIDDDDDDDDDVDDNSDDHIATIAKRIFHTET